MDDSWGEVNVIVCGDETILFWSHMKNKQMSDSKSIHHLDNQNNYSFRDACTRSIMHCWVDQTDNLPVDEF